MIWPLENKQKSKHLFLYSHNMYTKLVYLYSNKIESNTFKAVSFYFSLANINALLIVTQSCSLFRS